MLPSDVTQGGMSPGGADLHDDAFGSGAEMTGSDDVAFTNDAFIPSPRIYSQQQQPPVFEYTPLSDTHTGRSTHYT